MRGTRFNIAAKEIVGWVQLDGVASVVEDLELTIC
jgi:hypothetical protein